MSSTIHYRDLGKTLLWLCLYLAILTPFFLSYWLIGATEVLETTWLWSMAGIAALLTLAQKKGHYPLVLGLCSIAFWLKVEPYLGIYLFLTSAVLYGTLRIALPKRRLLFYILLITFALLVPKAIPLFFMDKPALWLWFRSALLLGFFLRYLHYEKEFQQNLHQDQKFFEHLGYILFIPQLLKLLNIRPSEQSQSGLEYPANLWPSIRLFFLGSFKLGLYQLHLTIPMGLQEGGASSFLAAWYQILTHYLLWFLWLSAHFDYAISLARLFGAQIPSNFNFPLLACSVQDFWKRWLVLHHRFIKEFIFLPWPKKLHIPFQPYSSVLLTFTASAFLFTSDWIGSPQWLPSPSFFWQWLPFFLSQGLLVCVQIAWTKRFPSHSLLKKVLGWIVTQSTVALSCLWLVGLQRFPIDKISAQSSLLVLRRAFFLE
jgi:D-alanyl-lipoteichoic acid acyltransferase DltB (MBOAT superfamily)